MKDIIGNELEVADKVFFISSSTRRLITLECIVTEINDTIMYLVEDKYITSSDKRIRKRIKEDSNCVLIKRNDQFDMGEMINTYIEFNGSLALHVPTNRIKKFYLDKVKNKK